MPPLTIAEITGEKCRYVFAPEWNNLRSHFRKKLFYDRAGIAPQLYAKGELGFSDGRRSHRDHTGIAKLPQQAIATLFVENHGDDCRGVQDQTGSPDSP